MSAFVTGCAKTRAHMTGSLSSAVDPVDEPIAVAEAEKDFDEALSNASIAVALSEAVALRN